MFQSLVVFRPDEAVCFLFCTLCPQYHNPLVEEASSIKPDYMFNRCAILCNMSLWQSTTPGLKCTECKLILWDGSSWIVWFWGTGGAMGWTEGGLMVATEQTWREKSMWGGGGGGMWDVVIARPIHHAMPAGMHWGQPYTTQLQSVLVCFAQLHYVLTAFSCLLLHLLCSSALVLPFVCFPQCSALFAHDRFPISPFHYFFWTCSCRITKWSAAAKHLN